MFYMWNFFEKTAQVISLAATGGASPSISGPLVVTVPDAHDEASSAASPPSFGAVGATSTADDANVARVLRHALLALLTRGPAGAEISAAPNAPKQGGAAAAASTSPLVGVWSLVRLLHVRAADPKPMVCTLHAYIYEI